MQLTEAMEKRNSTRAFTDRPVEKSELEALLKSALRSPSWGNTQPWDIIVVGGAKAQAMKDEFCERLSAGSPSCPDFEMPQEFFGRFQDRYKQVGREVFRLKEIGRDDQEARVNHYLNNFKGYGAPCLVYILVDATLVETVYPVFDAGLLAAHICLAATDRGLGTCLLAALAWYPDVIRKHLNLGEDKKVVIGIALGHPDPDDPVNTLRSGREDFDKSVSWVDM